MKLYDVESLDDYCLDGRYAVHGSKWHDAKTEKPKQEAECLLLLSGGEVHAGFWLEHANKYQRNTRKWKVYHGSHLVDEDKVIGWKPIEGAGN